MKRALTILCTILLVVFLFGGVSAAAIRMLRVGVFGGNGAADEVFSSGDLDGYIDTGPEWYFNSLSPAELIASYDVLLFHLETSSSINADWNTRLAPYLSAGGGVIWENPYKLSELNPVVYGEYYNSSSVYVTSSVSGLTDGVTNDFINSHFRLINWNQIFSPFLSTSDGYTVGLYCEYPVGGGRMVITGPDSDFHATRDGNAANQYNLLLNEINWVSSGNTASVPVPATILLLGSGIIGLAGARRKFKK